MSSKTAIVVGITGMDAESASLYLLNLGYNVIGTYRRNTLINIQSIYQKFNSHPKFSLEHCDITDSNSIRNLIQNALEKYSKIDEIYLIAAQSHVGESFISPEMTVITNGMSVYHFLENLRLLSIKTKLYFCATSELLGGDPSKSPFTEESEYECRSPYSIGKELGTRWIKYYNQTYGMFSTYGILFNHSNTSRHESFFIRRITKAAASIAAGKQKDLVLGNLNFYRDEHWSDFGVEMMYKMLQLDKPETFLICRGECHHGEQFLDAAFSHFNLKWQNYVKIDESRFRPNEVVKLVGNPVKAVEKLGWRPQRMPFSAHISLMCDYDYKLACGQTPERPNVFELYP